MTNDVIVSLLGYAALVALTVAQLHFFGRYMCGHGRMVVLAVVTAAFGFVVQLVLLNEDAQLCLVQSWGWCWRSFVRWIENWLFVWPASPMWLGKSTGFALANIFFLIFGPLALAVLARISYRLLASAAHNEKQDRNDRLRRLLLGRSSKRLYGTLLSFAVVFGGLVVTLASSNFRSEHARNLVDDLTKLIWAGPILAFGLLWSASRPIAPAAPGAPEPPTPVYDQPPSLIGLFNSYIEAYHDHLMFHAIAQPTMPAEADAPDIAPSIVQGNRLWNWVRDLVHRGLGRWNHVSPEYLADVFPEEPRSDAKTQMRFPRSAVGRMVTAASALGYQQCHELHHVLDAAFRGLWKTPGEHQLKDCPIFAESETFLHFILMAELVLSCQDRGGCALLLAPQSALERIEKQLRQALSARFAGHAQQIWNGTSQPHGLYDVLIVSPERIEADLLSRDDDGSLKDALDRLALVLVLNYHGIDPALLRIRLARLRRLTGNRSLDVVCQSEPRTGLASNLGTTISALVPVNPNCVEIGPPDLATRLWLFWRNEEPTLEQLLEREVGHADSRGRPMDIVPLTLLRAFKQSHRATIFDPHDRAHSKTIKDVLSRAPITVHVDATQYPENDRVVVIEDLANLISAARTNMNFMHHDEYLTHIVSHNYPMREFLLDMLRQAIGGSDGRLFSWMRFGEDYLPIAPHPTGGPTELAIDLATEFSRADSLKQCDVENRFSDVLPRGGVESLGIAPTKQGLEKLFKLQFDDAPEVTVLPDLGHEHKFEIKATGRNLEPRFLIPVQLGQTTISHVDQQDEGLTFAEGTLLKVGENFYKVLQVSNTLSVQLAELPHGRRPVYLFERNYVVRFDQRVTFVEGSKVPRRAGAELDELRLLLRGGYSRWSVAMAQAEETTFDLVVDWEGISVQKDSQNASIMLARLVIAKRQPKLEQPDTFSRIAFTLAATLQDTLRSFFPDLAANLAVMSPQAESAIQDFIHDRAHGSKLDRHGQHPFLVYPRLVGESFEPLVGQEGDTSSDMLRREYEGVTKGPAPERKIRELLDQFIRDAVLAQDGADRISSNPDYLLTTESGRLIDLIIVEDASHDRGAVRALFEDANWLKVVKAWGEFVKWAANQKGSGRLYYKFGQGRVPEVLALDETAEFLSLANAAERGSTGAKSGQEPR